MSEQETGIMKKRNRKPRTRMKQVYSKIREQMEFYFSDANLSKDRFLKKSIESTVDGYIPLETFLHFNKIKCLTGDADVLAEALNKKSDLLEVNSEKSHVRRTTAIQEPVNVDERTVYVEHLPQHVDHEWVKKLFSACGKVVYVSLPRYTSTGDLKGFAFVEFETVEGAQSACEELNNPPVNLSDRAGMFPKSSHQLEAIKKKLPDEQIKATQEKALEILQTECTDVAADDEVDETKPQNTAKDAESDNGAIQKSVAGDETTKPTSLKRSRTISEGNTDNATDLPTSPVKRKKSEVTFNIPPQGTKTDEEKSTGKKRAKKRKGRSKSSDDHVIDSKEEDTITEKTVTESIPEKKMKLEACESGAMETHVNESEGDSEGLDKGDGKGSNVSNSSEKCANKENKKKRRFRRKKPREEKEVPELRVLPKKEWLVLRDEYLQLQKTSMAMLKKTLGDVKLTANKDEEKSKHKEIEFVADVIVKVSAEQPIKRNELKAWLGDSVQIAYIDVRDENQSGYIRCKDPISAKTISDRQLDGHTFNMVSGEDEKQYWVKLSSDREAKLNSKGRHKKRGYQKWMDKAQKASIDNSEKKHIVFEDE